MGATYVWGLNEDPGVKLPQAYKGKGILVGVCDSGFDYHHPMFRNADGTLRIKWAWDVYTRRGATEGYQGIGSLYDTSEKILKAEGSVDSITYHGKRTLGDNINYDVNQSYKAGNEAVKEFYDKISSAELVRLLGMKRFFDYATERQMPAVVNCSFGGSMDFFDDDELMYSVYEKLVQVPGHIIVGSAGNEGDEDRYRHKKADKELSDSIINRELFSYLEFSATSDDFIITLRYSDPAHTEITFTPADLTNAQKDMKVKNVKS